MSSAPLKRILYISTVWPEPCSSAAGVRIHHILNSLKDINKILVVSPSKDNLYKTELTKLYNNVDCKQIILNSNSFDDLIKEYEPETVIYDRFIMEEQFSWRVRDLLPNCMHILDTQDLHFLRRYRLQILEESALNKNAVNQYINLREDKLTSFNGEFNYLSKDYTTWFNRLISKNDALEANILSAGYNIPLSNNNFCREYASICRSDGTLLVSPYEYDLLLHHGIPKTKLFTLPFYYNMKNFDDLKQTPFNDRKHFLSIGNYRHLPNEDSIRFLSALWPMIREKIPNVEFHSYGAYPNAQILALNNPKIGFYVRGVLPSDKLTCTMLKYKALLAPIRFGAGIKGKIADAWCHKLPVVTTPTGSEGMEFDGFGGLVAPWTNPEAFVENAVLIYQNEKIWNISSKNGYETVKKEYNSNCEMNWKNWMLIMFSDLKNKRKDDALRKLFCLEKLNSCKYTSQFLQLKSKKKISS